MNIGAGGLAFYTSTPLMSGTLIELRLVLLPENTGVSSYARVVCCTRAAESEGNGYRIAVEYENMDEEMRDIICRHVLTVERESIRKSGSTDDA